MVVNNFKEFFRNYSKNVDKADNQYFWKLSDDIIFSILKKYLEDGKKKTLLDAGGGTGRWIIKLKSNFDFNYVLCDISEYMLKKAKNNFKENDISNVKIIKSDLKNLSKINDNSIDYIISIYNPISFIDNVQKVFNEFYRVLKEDGFLLVMGQGFYNSIFSKINNYLADSSELKELVKTKQVKWDKQIPSLNVFTQESLENYGQKVGLSPVKSYGITVFAQPGLEDFDPENKKKSLLSKKLENDEIFYNKVFKIEMKYNGLSSVVNRGMNILSVFKK